MKRDKNVMENVGSGRIEKNCWDEFTEYRRNCIKGVPGERRENGTVTREYDDKAFYNKKKVIIGGIAHAGAWVGGIACAVGVGALAILGISKASKDDTVYIEPEETEPENNIEE